MEQFTSANRLIGQIQEHIFPRLESCTDGAVARAIESEFEELIGQIGTIEERLEIAVNKAQPAARSGLKFKLDQLRYDHKSLQSTFRTIQQRRLQREREHREREELLTRRFTTNEHARTSAAAADTQIDFGNQAAEYYENERSRLHGFHRNVDDLLATGGAALASLREQGGTLRVARNRVAEVLNSIGLSNSVMHLIEKRAFTDRFILFGGMFLLTALMFLIWKYLS